MHREQLALDQVRLGRNAQADRDIGLAHGEIEFFIGHDQRDADIGIEVDEFADLRRQPMGAEPDRGGDLQIAVRTFAAVGQLGAAPIPAS